MLSYRIGSCIAAGWILAGCANAPPRPADEQVLVRTEPGAASCRLLQSGAHVAEIAATPAVATVPRRKGSLEVVCSKPGYLEARRSLNAELADLLDSEAGVRRPRMLTTSADALGAAGSLAWSASVPVGASIGGFPVGAPALFPAGAVVGPVLGIVAVAVYLNSDTSYGYRSPPPILLAPSTFPSRVDCDAYFVSWRGRIEDAARADIDRIDRECRPWPCGASDARCPNPACEEKRARVQVELARQLREITALHEQVAIDAP